MGTGNLESFGGTRGILLGRSLQEHKFIITKTFSVTQVSAGRDRCLRSSARGRRSPESACDECGEEYSYGPTDLVRLKWNWPGAFQPHPRFLSVC